MTLTSYLILYLAQKSTEMFCYFRPLSTCATT